MKKTLLLKAWLISFLLGLVRSGPALLSGDLLDSAPSTRSPAPLTRPPRGWSSEGVYDCAMDCSAGFESCLSEITMRNMADELATPAWRDAGYDWLVLGRCWAHEARDAWGNIWANDTRFPSGLKALAGYLHDKSQQLALYVRLGPMFHQQGNMPSLHDNILRDVRTITSWNVDMIYVDIDPDSDVNQVTKDHHELRAAIQATGSQLRIACVWPRFLLAKGMQLNYADIEHVCDVYLSAPALTSDSSWDDVMKVANFVTDRTQRTPGPGKWEDLGMLLAGEGGLTPAHWEAQAALWSMYRSAMFVSADVTKMATDVSAAVLQADLLAVSDDDLNPTPVRTRLQDNIHTWTRALSYGDHVILLLNASPNVTAAITAPLATLGVTMYPAYHLRDVTGSRDYGQVYVSDDVSLTIAPHSAVMLRAYAEH